MATLVAIKGPSTGKSFELQKDSVLGRSLGSDIYIGDLNVSRRHACIHVSGEGDEVEDLGSGNGTFVNEVAVQRRRLADGDLIRIGGSTFRYQAARRQAWSEEVLTMLADLNQVGGNLAATLGSKSASSPLIRDGTTPEGGRITDTFSAVTEARAVSMLESMCRVADVIATEMDLPRLLDKILDHLLEVFPQTERGFVLLVNPATGELVPEAVKVRPGGDGGIQMSRTIIDQVMERGEGVIRGHTLAGRPRTPAAGQLIGEGSHRLELQAADTDGEGGEPKMGAPLIYRGESLGTLHLEASPGSRSFTHEGLALLEAIARQAAVAIASARATQALLQQQRLEDDLRLARQIQRSFLPQRLEAVQGLVFETHYASANQVGGDFYDIVPITPTRIGVLVGDISGHGVSAALLMAKVATDIRLLARSGLGAGEVLSRANRTLLESGQEAMFATVAFILIDLEERTLTVANAGHQPPLVASSRFSGLAELDESTSVALGVLADLDYPEKAYALLPGDVVVLYTDGINEAVNRQGHDFGMDRLRAAIAREQSPTPHAVLQHLLAELHRFVGGAPQQDDQTLVLLSLGADLPTLLPT